MTARSAVGRNLDERGRHDGHDVGRPRAAGECRDLAEEVARTHRRQPAVAAVRLGHAGRRHALEDEVGGRRVLARGHDACPLRDVADERVVQEEVPLVAG